MSEETPDAHWLPNKAFDLLARSLAMLIDLEYAGDDRYPDWPVCPSCQASKNFGLHKVHCELKKLIDDLGNYNPIGTLKLEARP